MPNNGHNNGAVFLLGDHRTILQSQPFTRCEVGGPATSLLTFREQDLYGDGISGAHGGSRLSSLGGSLRLGELRPGQQGPRHALKLNVYGRQAFYRCQTKNQCSTWPAINADRYAVGNYGVDNDNQNTAMKMGALLAIPASTDLGSLGLETEPASQLAWTLQNYGAYIVDDTYDRASTSARKPVPKAHSAGNLRPTMASRSRSGSRTTRTGPETCNASSGRWRSWRTTPRQASVGAGSHCSHWHLPSANAHLKFAAEGHLAALESHQHEFGAHEADPNGVRPNLSELPCRGLPAGSTRAAQSSCVQTRKTDREICVDATGPTASCHRSHTHADVPRWR